MKHCAISIEFQREEFIYSINGTLLLRYSNNSELKEEKVKGAGPPLGHFKGSQSQVGSSLLIISSSLMIRHYVNAPTPPCEDP